ncbi:hypothetical protein HXZ66_06710 [Bacillus sp. A116_S68]|nr:hypothetical protein HXZ66_06710 [Bacillus sp. A116_S68]
MIMPFLNLLQGLAFLGLVISSFLLFRHLQRKKKQSKKSLSWSENVMYMIVKLSLIIWPFTFVLMQLDIMFG